MTSMQAKESSSNTWSPAQAFGDAELQRQFKKKLEIKIFEDEIVKKADKKD